MSEKRSGRREFGSGGCCTVAGVEVELLMAGWFSE